MSHLASDIKVVRMIGGTIEDTELIEGLVFTQSVQHGAGGPTRIQDAKIGLIQFQLSPPKTSVCIFPLYRALHSSDGWKNCH